MASAILHLSGLILLLVECGQDRTLHFPVAGHDCLFADLQVSCLTSRYPVRTQQTSYFNTWSGVGVFFNLHCCFQTILSLV